MRQVAHGRLRALCALIFLTLSCAACAKAVVVKPSSTPTSASAEAGVTPTIFLAPDSDVPAARRMDQLSGPISSRSLVFKPIRMVPQSVAFPAVAPAKQRRAAASAFSGFTPAAAPPPAPSVPSAPSSGGAGFTIGPGDTVQIDVLGHGELSVKGNVSGDGRVSVGLLGPILVGGLSPLQASERIAKAYKDGRFLVSPQVTVTMVEYQSQLLSVLGEVRTPGRFPVKSRLSVLDGIALAGGIAERGGSIAYLLRSENNIVNRYEIDLDALVQPGSLQPYFEMLAGDTLMVPAAPLFYIYGEVRNPNAFKLKPGMTVIQALSLAGGLTDKGSNRRLDIRRRDERGRLSTLSASLNDLLQTDDVIYVRERLF